MTKKHQLINMKIDGKSKCIHNENHSQHASGTSALIISDLRKQSLEVIHCATNKHNKFKIQKLNMFGIEYFGNSIWRIVNESMSVKKVNLSKFLLCNKKTY